ncbi:MATE family efflux transporter [uncultured Draconibacterium sp.]|uniref:MATE family efflux transporter n=1 Tax=uncultured Draconibacterium sp. TaxID=1573823 RepID=UPI0029C8CB98|nr:MATE family efflux transporter [uncultured Draconibacterium sp.]
MTKRSRNLTEGDVKKHLMQLTWPMLLGLIGMVIFNLIDTYFVGKLGVQQLAAMSFSFPVVMFLNSVAMGVGIGTTSLISRNIIHADKNEVKAMSGRAMVLGLIVVLVFVTIGLLTIRPLFTALGAETDVLKYVDDYMTIWYFGVPFVVIPMIGNNIVRATGDTFTPGMIMLFSAVVNAILDPFMIFGYGPFPEMGIKGAAWATVITRSMGLVAILYILIKRNKMLTFRLDGLRNTLSTWKKVLYVGGPASLSMLITPISVGLITKILAGFGKEAVAAFGVASRVEMFALMVVAALGSVLIIFVGQNFSKQKFDRIKQALTLSFKFSLIWGAAVFVVLLFLGDSIAALFSTDAQVVEITIKYFYIIGASYGFLGMLMLSTSSFNGINKPLPSTVFSMIRMLIIYVPLAWLGSVLFGISGVFWAGLLANILVGIFAARYLFKTVKRVEVATA